MIFKGYLSRLYKQESVRCFLWTQGVALKDFTPYAKATTERIANNARRLVTDAGHDFTFFAAPTARRRSHRRVAHQFGHFLGGARLCSTRTLA